LGAALLAALLVASCEGSNRGARAGRKAHPSIGNYFMKTKSGVAAAP